MMYATPQEVQEYIGTTDVIEERIIKRASEDMDHVTLGNIDTTNEDHLEALKKAVSAQIEYWLNIDESMAINGSIESFSIGKFSMHYGKKGMPILAPRARRYLFTAGLLYRGV